MSTDGAGDPSGPLFSEELRSWGDGIQVETYDGVEVAPQLASVTGPSLLVIDDELRIVDVTAGAAATLGWAAAELIGQRVADLSATESELFEANIARLMRDGRVEAEARWHVPEVGRVFMRLIARRDVPIPGPSRRPRTPPP
ncbi:MAG: PAS domain-containing protein [Candidatus Limnocylindrales bacterium]